MKWLFIYLVLLYALWHVMNIEADTVSKGVVAPLAFSVVFIALVVWLSLKVGGRSVSSNGSAGGMGTGGSCGGGDGGGGGGAC